jgi:hypothetical protein
MRAFSSLYLPNGFSEQIGWCAELQRGKCDSPSGGLRRYRLSELLEKVRCPALVPHSRNDGGAFR